MAADDDRDGVRADRAADGAAVAGVTESEAEFAVRVERAELAGAAAAPRPPAGTACRRGGPACRSRGGRRRSTRSSWAAASSRTARAALGVLVERQAPPRSIESEVTASPSLVSSSRPMGLVCADEVGEGTAHGSTLRAAADSALAEIGHRGQLAWTAGCGEFPGGGGCLDSNHGEHRIPHPRRLRSRRLDHRPRLQQLRPRRHGDRDPGGHGCGRRRRDRRGRHLLRHRRHLRQGARPVRDADGPALWRASATSIVLATKFGMDMAGANGPDWGARARAATSGSRSSASLRRLRTDWIDLYQLHRPDGVTPIEETLETLDDLIARGQDPLHRPLQPRRLADRRGGVHRRRLNGHPKFISAQNEYSLLARDAERELLPGGERATGSASCRTSRSTTACSPASSRATAARRTAGS